MSEEEYETDGKYLSPRGFSKYANGAVKMLLAELVTKIKKP